jgi:tetratricopeptide (TPR) repeat protein
MNAIRTLIIGCCVIGTSWGGWTQQSRAEQCRSADCPRIDAVTNSDAESQAYGLLQSAKSKYGWNQYSTNYWESFQDLNKAIELNPNLAKAYYARGLLREREFNKPEKALEDYDQALKLDPLLVNAYYVRGTLKLSADQSSAATDFQTAVKIDPLNPWGYYGLGLVSANNRNSREALANYDRAIHLNSLFAEAYYQRGVLQEEQIKNDKAALADYQKAVSLNHRYHEAESKLAFLRWRTNKSGHTNSNIYNAATSSFQNGPNIKIQEAIKLFREL